MKSFQHLHEIFRLQYIDLSFNNQNISFSWKNALVLLTQAQLSINSLAFLIFEADTNFERGIAFYVFSSILFTININSNCIMKKHDISVLIKTFEAFIQESEKHSLGDIKLLVLNTIVDYAFIISRITK